MIIAWRSADEFHTGTTTMWYPKNRLPSPHWKCHDIPRSDCIFPMCSTGCLNRFRWWLSTRLPLYMMKPMEIWPFSKPFRSWAIFGHKKSPIGRPFCLNMFGHKNSNWFPPFWDWNPPPFWNVPQASYILYLFWQLAGGAKQFSQVPLISRSELLKSLQCLDENLEKNGWWRYHGIEGDTYYITYIYICVHLIHIYIDMDITIYKYIYIIIWIPC